MNNPHVFLGCLVLVAACGPAPRPLSPEAALITLSEEPPPADFEQLERISAQSGKGCGVMGTPGSREDAEAGLRAEAARLGASYVRLTEVSAPKPNHQCMEHEYKLSGTAYRKPSSAAPKAMAPAPTPAHEMSLGVVQDYEPGSPASTPAQATAVSRLQVALSSGDPSGNALAVDYGCSGTGSAGSSPDLDVWSPPRTSDWSRARALSFRVKADQALTLRVSFVDGNQVSYSQTTGPLPPGSWQLVQLAFEKFAPISAGSPGAPPDRSQVARFGFAPDGCSNGRFLIDDFRLNP